MKKILFLIFILIPALIFGFFLLRFSEPQPNNSSNNSPKPQTFSYSKNTWLGSYAIHHPEYKTMPIIAMSENSVSFQRPDGKTETDFVGSPINYKDENGQWKPIDPTLKQVGSFFTGDGIITKIGTDGTVIVADQNFSQKTTRFGYFNPEVQTFTSLETLGQGQIEDNVFVQKGSWYKNQITVFDIGLKEELVLEKNPNEIASSSALGGTPRDDNYLMFETEVEGIDLPDGWIAGSFTAGKLTFHPPIAYDANNIEAETKRYAKKINGKQYIFTGIPVSWLKTAVYPVVIDPDYSGNTADGNVSGNTTTYAAARATATVVSTSDEQRGVGQRQFSGSDWYVTRVFLKFDTSAIGTDTVTQVNLKLVLIFDISTTDFNVQIVDQDWSAQDPLSTSNKEAAYDNCLSGTADSGSPWRNTSGISINTQYASPNLDTTWINKTGYTYYSLRSDRDYAGTSPPDNEQVNVALQDNTTAGYRPVLTIVHAAVPTSTPTPTPTPTPYTVNVRGMNLRGGVNLR